MNLHRVTDFTKVWIFICLVNLALFILNGLSMSKKDPPIGISLILAMTANDPEDDIGHQAYFLSTTGLFMFTSCAEAILIYRLK